MVDTGGATTGDGVEQQQQLAHDGGEGDLAGLAALAQTLVEAFQVGAGGGLGTRGLYYNVGPLYFLVEAMRQPCPIVDLYKYWDV